MTEGATSKEPQISNDHINDVLQRFAERFGQPLR